jgi:hypothetical protein
MPRFVDERARLTDRGNSLDDEMCGAPGWAGRRCELPPHDVNVMHRVSGVDVTGVWKLEWYDRERLRDLLGREAREAEATTD